MEANTFIKGICYLPGHELDLNHPTHRYCFLKVSLVPEFGQSCLASIFQKEFYRLHNSYQRKQNIVVNGLFGEKLSETLYWYEVVLQLEK